MVITYIVMVFQQDACGLLADKPAQTVTLLPASQLIPAENGL